MSNVKHILLSLLKVVPQVVATILVPSKVALVAVFIFWLADAITGIWASVHVRHEKFTSNGLRRGTAKLIVFLAAILLADLFGRVLGFDQVLAAVLPVSVGSVKLMAFWIIGHEAKSIGENTTAISGSGANPFTFLAKLITGVTTKVVPQEAPKDDQQP